MNASGERRNWLRMGPYYSICCPARDMSKRAQSGDEVWYFSGRLGRFRLRANTHKKGDSGTSGPRAATFAS
jgi:hypothetical protein